MQTLGKYQILERIATGGMAEIFKARLEGIGGFQRTIAIKRILPNLSRNRDYIEMLRDEARVAGQLSHANIVQHMDLREHDGVWFIAMEYVHGRDLGRVLERATERGLLLPVPHAVFVTIELLKGLEYAHGRTVVRGGRSIPMNIIHRDISPPNILLSYSGEVKLTDFGIARASLKVMETVSGIVRGRFDYMSPEQAGGSRDLDQRSDLFAVGVVLYEMLAGVHPFRAATELGTVERLREGRYQPMHVHNPEVPASLEGVVARALQIDPDDRFTDATAFKEELDRFFHDAGFYFTHNTLGAYIRSLFPEADPSTRRHDGGPVSLGGDAGDDLELGEAEQPTRRLETALVRDVAALERLNEPTQDTDGPTMIRQNPLDDDLLLDPASDFEDEVATVVRPNAIGEWEAANEQETVIRKSPLTEENLRLAEKKLALPTKTADRSGDTLQSGNHEDEPLPKVSLASRAPAPGGRGRVPAARAPAAPDRSSTQPSAKPRTEPRREPANRPSVTDGRGRRRRSEDRRRDDARPVEERREPARPPSSVGWLGVLLLPVALALGFVAGAAGAAVLGWYLDGPVPAPSVRIDGPAGDLTVDGRAYTSGDPLNVGAHTVKFAAHGRTVTVEVDLTIGQEAVVVVPPPK